MAIQDHFPPVPPVRQGTAIPTVCPVHKYTRVALGEMGLKTGGKSTVGTDEATVAAVMDWHIQPSPADLCTGCCSVMTGLIT